MHTYKPYLSAFATTDFNYRNNPVSPDFTVHKILHYSARFLD